MSSKKKNLDDELSDISSDEREVVNFAKKGEKKIKKKKNTENFENKETNKKILGKKINRNKNDDESSESSEEEKNVKKKKTAHDSDDKVKNKKTEIEIESSDEEDEKKMDKKGKNKKEKNNSDSENESDESDKINKKNKNVKMKNIKKEASESEEEEKEESEKEESKKEESEKEESEKDESEKEESEKEESEKVKPKKTNKKEIEKKKEKKEKKNVSENESSEEPKLVKNESQQEKEPQKEYNSGTWPELFVNNLSYKTTDESMKKYFSKYGEIESTKIVHDKETGRPKGVGFCKFCDPSSAAEAIKDNGNLFLDGRPITVSYSNDKKGSAKVKKSIFKGDRNFQGEKFSIFIGNLSFKTNEDGIKNLFEDCGNIIDIRIAKTPEGRPRGFAHVDFDSNEAVENALEKTGYKLDGRELRIDRTTNKPNEKKGVFGEHSYKKNFNKEKEVNDIEKAKKTGKIINTGSKVQKIEDSDDDSDE